MQGLDGGVRVPETLAEVLSPAWLSSALGPRYPGISVIRVVPGPVATRISTNAFFTIEVDGGLPAGLPAALCAKGYFSDTGNAAMVSAGEAEACFYRDAAGPLDIPTLPAVYADLDPASGRNVVITEDISVSGARFVDPLLTHSPAEVARTLERYAGLHGRTWEDEKVLGADWLAPRIARTKGIRGAAEIQQQFDGPVGSLVPPAARDGEALVRAYAALPEITGRDPVHCLLHGDAHIGNLFIDRHGQFALLDWQLVQRGPWYVDVGYHIGSSLAVDDRRSSERDLLAHYLDHLAGHGVDRPGWPEVWAGYRCGLVYGLYLWSITQKVKPEITTELLGRLGTAAADHDVYAQVRPPA